MSRARDKFKELRDGVKEIEYLREEKQEYCLGKVSMNTHNSKGHTGEVAVGVAHEDLSGVPIEAK